MRILIDECVHVGVKAAFPGHAVKTVSEIGWHSAKDGPLLAYAQERFDVFVTIDRKLERQHNLKELKLGFVLARVPNNKIESSAQSLRNYKGPPRMSNLVKCFTSSIHRCGHSGRF